MSHADYETHTDPTAAQWDEDATRADDRNDAEWQAKLDNFAEKYQRLGRMDALTQLLNELRTYSYPVEFQRFVAAKLAKESGVELAP